MTAVYYTADTHFGHTNMTAEGKGWRPFRTVREHDETLIERWNATVKPGDTVWHLGDVGMGTEDHILECVARLNGAIHLVTGNHDVVWPGNRHAQKRQRAWLSVFASVQQYARHRFLHEQVLLNHFPYDNDMQAHHVGPDRYAPYRPPNLGGFLLHGHVHTEWSVRGRQINVGVDAHDFRPVSAYSIADLIGTIRAGDGS